jgi:hypothetical protein
MTDYRVHIKVRNARLLRAIEQVCTARMMHIEVTARCKWRALAQRASVMELVEEAS